MQSLIGATHCFLTGDMEFKQNKFLPSEKQIVTASPDVNTVSGLTTPLLFFLKHLL